MCSFLLENHCFWFCVLHINVLMLMLNYYVFINVSICINLCIYLYIFMYLSSHLFLYLFNYLEKSWDMFTWWIPIEEVHFNFPLLISVLLFSESMTSWLPILNMFTSFYKPRISRKKLQINRKPDLLSNIPPHNSSFYKDPNIKIIQQ